MNRSTNSDRTWGFFSLPEHRENFWGRLPYKSLFSSFFLIAVLSKLNAFVGISINVWSNILLANFRTVWFAFNRKRFKLAWWWSHSLRKFANKLFCNTLIEFSTKAFNFPIQITNTYLNMEAYPENSFRDFSTRFVFRPQENSGSEIFRQIDQFRFFGFPFKMGKYCSTRCG